MERVTFIIALLFYFLYSVASAKTPMVIIIDDFGNNMNGTNEMLEVDYPINVAVIPFQPDSQKEARLAIEKGHEVLIHLSLEPLNANRAWYGPKTITTGLSDSQIKDIVYEAIEQLPEAKGMNHHMGSKASADKRVMRAILEVCKEKNLYYVDSRTNYKSVIGEVAVELGVSSVNNMYFFDHYHDYNHINNQALKVLKEVKDNRPVIIIGHVGLSGHHMAKTLKNYSQRWKDAASIMKVSDYLASEYEILHLMDN